MKATTTLGLLAPVLLALGASDLAAAEPAAPAMIVVIDQATGLPRMPTAAEYQAFRAKAGNKPSTAPGFRQFIRPADENAARATLTRLPGGGESALVPETLTPELIAEQAADGSLQIRHRDEAPAAKQAHTDSEGWAHE